MELLPTTSGRHLLKMHIAYKGYMDDSDMFRRLMISASVRDSDGHDRIYWSTLHGRWVDDSASEWINDENLTQKCLEIPLDLVENNPGSGRKQSRRCPDLLLLVQFIRFRVYRSGY